MIRAVVFDLWGTLILNPADPNVNGKVAVPRLLGLDEKVFKRILKDEWGTHSDWNEREFFGALLKKLDMGRDTALLEKILQMWERHYNAVTLAPGAAELLDLLKRAGYKIGLLSNTEPPSLKLLSRFDIDRYFHFKVLSYDYKLVKPARELFQIAITKAGVAANEICVIGDKPDIDIWPARQLGMRTIWIDLRGASGVDYPADVKINKLSDVPKAMSRL